MPTVLAILGSFWRMNFLTFTMCIKSTKEKQIKNGYFPFGRHPTIAFICLRITTCLCLFIKRFSYFNATHWRLFATLASADIEQKTRFLFQNEVIQARKLVEGKWLTCDFCLFEFVFLIHIDLPMLLKYVWEFIICHITIWWDKNNNLALRP